MLSDAFQPHVVRLANKEFFTWRIKTYLFAKRKKKKKVSTTVPRKRYVSNGNELFEFSPLPSAIEGLKKKRFESKPYKRKESKPKPLLFLGTSRGHFEVFGCVVFSPLPPFFLLPFPLQEDTSAQTVRKRFLFLYRLFFFLFWREVKS